jgi:hypothetical protein
MWQLAMQNYGDIICVRGGTNGMGKLREHVYSRKTRRFFSRLIAGVVSTALVVSGLTTPVITTWAADTTIDVATLGKTDSSVTATVTSLAGQDNDGYYEYEITINNQSSTDINDWVAVATVGGTVSNVESSWSTWAGATAKYSDGKLYIYPNTSVKSAYVSANGGSVTYNKIGYSATAYTGTISNITVYYSSNSNAFSSFTGSLESSSGSVSDSSTDIATDIDYNYAKLLQESLYFYDANMCGDDVDENSEYSWRRDCHLSDKTVTYNGKTVDVSGGYHDAGDHAKFGLPQAYSASVLGMAYYQYKDSFTDLGLYDHYKRIMDHFVEYFEKCTILDDSGNVEAFCYQVGSGNTDHSYWGAPENQDSVQGGRQNQAYFTNSSTPATDIVCETAAALAIYSYNFNDSKALSYAEKLFAYANSFSNKSVVKIETDSATCSPFYNSSSWADDYALAAAWLYKATNAAKYKDYYSSAIGTQNYVGWVLSWDDVTAAAFLYGPDESQRQYVTSFMSSSIADNTKTDDNGYYFLQQWGSARYNCAMQFMGLAYDSLSGNQSYSSWASGQMKYLLGNNAGKHCFIVGYNNYSVKYPHHRAASGYDDVSSNGTTTQKHVITGALVGGPTSTSAAYVDTATDYTSNEVALDYNAGLVAAAAGLYSYISASGTDEEKAVQKVVSVSEISSELRNISSSSTTEATTEATTEVTTEVITEATTEVTTEVITEATTQATTETITEATTENSSTEENNELPKDINVTGITLNKQSVNLIVGDKETIGATVLPENATNKQVSWSSLDDKVAEVDQTGVITAVGSGTTNIIVKALDGSNAESICTIIVKEKENNTGNDSTENNSTDSSSTEKNTTEDESTTESNTGSSTTETTSATESDTGSSTTETTSTTEKASTTESNSESSTTEKASTTENDAESSTTEKESTTENNAGNGNKGNVKTDISNAAISKIAAQYYTGKAICPQLTVTYNGKKLVAGTDYTVAYSSNKNIGTAKVTITGKGNYTGTLVGSFEITVKKGSTYKVGNYKYKITSAKTDGKGTVTLTKVVKKTSTVNIGATVKIGGKSFKITAIGKDAFKNNKKIKKLTIGKNVTSIGKNAFYGCKKLKKITIKTKKLKSNKVGSKAFAGIKANVKIKAPKTKKLAYKKILYKKGINKEEATIS